MSVKNSLKNGVNSVVKTAAHAILIKIIIGGVLLLTVSAALILKNIFDIETGIALIISCIFILTVYIVYKIVKRAKNRPEKVENPTLWDKMGISAATRFTFVNMAQKLLLVFMPICYLFLLVRFGVEKGTILMVVFIAVLICLNYKLHVKLYERIRLQNRAKYAYALRENADTVCKNCGALISRNDKICFNCGAKTEQKGKTTIIIAVLIIVVIACMRLSK
ncbi:MAG: zinc ribbon domain-containing protein [Campylobacteraceae bacterium]|jgi:ribosomal protein L32|nr:zinc ribbon domain-containing protein [Campylobacteraceae bacterium]